MIVLALILEVFLFLCSSGLECWHMNKLGKRNLVPCRGYCAHISVMLSTETRAEVSYCVNDSDRQCLATLNIHELENMGTTICEVLIMNTDQPHAIAKCQASVCQSDGCNESIIKPSPSQTNCHIPQCRNTACHNPDLVMPTDPLRLTSTSFSATFATGSTTPLPDTDAITTGTTEDETSGPSTFSSYITTLQSTRGPSIPLSDPRKTTKKGSTTQKSSETLTRPKWSSTSQDKQTPETPQRATTTFIDLTLLTTPVIDSFEPSKEAALTEPDKTSLEAITTPAPAYTTSQETIVTTMFEVAVTSQKIVNTKAKSTSPNEEEDDKTQTDHRTFSDDTTSLEAIATTASAHTTSQETIVTTMYEVAVTSQKIVKTKANYTSLNEEKEESTLKKSDPTAGDETKYRSNKFNNNVVFPNFSPDFDNNPNSVERDTQAVTDGAFPHRASFLSLLVLCLLML